MVIDFFRKIESYKEIMQEMKNDIENSESQLMKQVNLQSSSHHKVIQWTTRLVCVQCTVRISIYCKIRDFCEHNLR